MVLVVGCYRCCREFAFCGLREKEIKANAPLVIAHGGFSRLFPNSSEAAHQFAGQVSLANVIFWCGVQLTKDAAGVCAPNLNLASDTDISSIFQNQSNTYSVNGVSIQGWFSVDFTLKELASVKCGSPAASWWVFGGVVVGCRWRERVVGGGVWSVVRVEGSGGVRGYRDGGLAEQKNVKDGRRGKG
ncbi:hypothetical protein RHSIM_Rhsim13G0109400 [Rhododendron simsii]|uniref:glycerophosphodiester phosphodiesterase n=1 Tax=Rhododendron simsii TaxID=118357 RepID=A0A834FYE5_RHOSS|nr:hypothetical protein RHSIM_Rhsim13G0109400 [Rhododendron simsii]